MNPIRLRRLKNQLRMAARLHAAGDLTEAYYTAFAAHTLFELAGRVLRHGDAVSRVDFELAVPRALRLPTAYQWDAPHLLAEYGPYDRVPTSLAPGTYDTATRTIVKVATEFRWETQAQGLYDATVPLVSPLPRFEAFVADLRKRYPTLTGTGAWLASLIVAGLVGAVLARMLAGPPTVP